MASCYLHYCYYCATQAPRGGHQEKPPAAAAAAPAQPAATQTPLPFLGGDEDEDVVAEEGGRRSGGARLGRGSGGGWGAYVTRGCHAEVNGFNNQRQSLELAALVARVTGRTLLLPTAGHHAHDRTEGSVLRGFDLDGLRAEMVRLARSAKDYQQRLARALLAWVEVVRAEVDEAGPRDEAT